MCQPETDKARAVRRIAAIATLGAVLAGCSDLYYDRRDTIVLYGGDFYRSEFRDTGDRPVAAVQQQQQHSFQRPAGAGGNRPLSQRQGESAGRSHHLGRTEPATVRDERGAADDGGKLLDQRPAGAARFCEPISDDSIMRA